MVEVMAYGDQPFPGIGCFVTYVGNKYSVLND